MTRSFRRMRRRLALGASGVAVMAMSVAAGTAPAATLTFGADLVRPANNTATCATVPWYPVGGQSSCTFYSSAPGPSFYAPASGTVTRVRVRTGPTTGPMQVLVMYSLYQNNVSDPGHPYYACCYVAQYGPTFTPAANAITSVPTSLSMVEDPTPPPTDGTTNAEGDFLAISVLDANTPIPATSDSNSFFTGFAPAPTRATAPARGPYPPPVSGTTGGHTAHIAMNADLNTGGAGGTIGRRPPPPTFPGTPIGALRPITINPSGDQISGNNGSLPLTCALSVTCNGTVTLRRFGASSTARKTKPTLYGTARFSVPAGHTRAVRVALNAAARKALRGRRSLTVTVAVTVGAKVVTATVTLKRGPKT